MKIRGLFFLVLCCIKSFVVNSQQPDFNYREPYFLGINTTSFSKEFKTDRLDDNWGIWGHGLMKIVENHTHSNDVYATIKGEKNKSQFCFSSQELKKIINEEIKLSNYKKHLIAPQDNMLSCQCDKCKILGNTEKNASPAVFRMLKELAEKNTKTKLYALVYQSVNKTPNFALPENIGVFYSTIDYQKGIPYENQKEFKTLKNDLNLWKQKFKDIIIWDYALNFDNYHDFYPALHTIQKNLNFFKKAGVKGVFFNGSETYSILQDLKTTLLAKLLWDTSINLEEEITRYISSNYPKGISKYLLDYYLSIENRFFTTPEPLGIYSSIKQAQTKYLKKEEFFNFYKKIRESYSDINTPDLKTTALLSSLTYLKLELIRANEITKDSRKEIIQLLAFLDRTTKEAGILFLDEVKNTVKSYKNEWYKLLLTPHRLNYLYKQPLKILSALDEDYQDTTILNDNSFGFLDYNTNWFIVSVDNLTIELTEEQLKKGNNLVLSFLNDPKHHIFFPENIVILRNERILSKIEIATSNKKTKKEIVLSLNGIDKKRAIKFQINIPTAKKRASIACDEIILKD